MVELNFTIFVELGLFLVFIWGTNKLIIRPMLQTMDQRETHIEEGRRGTEEDTDRAEALDSEYATEMAAARRVSNDAIEKARREAQEKRSRLIRERKKSADEQVRVVHGEVEACIAQERAKFDALVPELSRSMTERLGLGGQRR